MLAISERASAHTRSRTRERPPTRAPHTRRPQARLQAVGRQFTPSRGRNIFSSDFAFRRPPPSGRSCFQQSATTAPSGLRPSLSERVRAEDDEFKLTTRLTTKIEFKLTTRLTTKISRSTPSPEPYDDDLAFSSDSGFRRPPPTRPSCLRRRVRLRAPRLRSSTVRLRLAGTTSTLDSVSTLDLGHRRPSALRCARSQARLQGRVS